MEGSHPLEEYFQQRRSYASSFARSQEIEHSRRKSDFREKEGTKNYHKEICTDVLCVSDFSSTPILSLSYRLLFDENWKTHLRVVARKVS